MKIDEIIRNLLDQVQDREDSIDEDDPDCIFRRDAAALREAAQILQQSRDRQMSCEQRKPLLAQARVLSVERRPEACLGCGFEHSCSTHGCAVINKLVELAAPVTLKVDALFSVPKSYSKARAASCRANEARPTAKPDADNILKAVADALNGVAYSDDSAVVEMHVAKRYGASDGLVVRLTGKEQEA